MRYPAQEDDYDVDIFNQNFAELSHIIENWKTISLINDLTTTKAGQGALDASQGKRLLDELKNRIKGMHVLGGYIDGDSGVSPEFAARGISLDDTVQAVYDKLENGSLTIIYTNSNERGYGKSLPTTEGSILFIYKHGSRGSLQFFGYRTGKSWTAGMRDGTFSGWKSCEGAPLINNLLTTGVGLGALDASLGNKLALMIEQSEIRANEKIAAVNQHLTASDGSQFRYGKTADGRSGYIITGEDGADTVVPFSSVPDLTIYGYVSGDETATSAPSAIQIPTGVYKKIKYSSGSYATMYANGYSNGDIMHSFSGSSRGTATTGTLIPADVNFIRFAQGHGRAGYVVLTAVV